MANNPPPPGQPPHGVPPQHRNPYEAAPSYGYPPNQPPGQMPAHTPGKLLAPAIALLICGVFNLLYAVVNIIGLFLPRQPQAIPPEWVGNEFLEAVHEGMQNPDRVSGSILSIIWILLGILLIVGAIQMMRRKSFRLAFTAAIVAIIPCTGIMDCCLLAEVGIGIWAIYILNDQYIKRMFH